MFLAYLANQDEGGNVKQKIWKYREVFWTLEGQKIRIEQNGLLKF